MFYIGKVLIVDQVRVTRAKRLYVWGVDTMGGIELQHCNVPRKPCAITQCDSSVAYHIHIEFGNVICRTREGLKL